MDSIIKRTVNGPAASIRLNFPERVDDRQGGDSRSFLVRYAEAFGYDLLGNERPNPIVHSDKGFFAGGVYLSIDTL